MYVSRAVRTIRDDPVAGESVDLVLETDDDADPDAVASAAESVGASVERHLQFDDLIVSVTQDRVADVCEIDALAAVQTTNVVEIHPDEAEEDVDPNPED